MKFSGTLNNVVIWLCTLFFLQGVQLYAQLNESDTAAFQLRTGLTGAWQKGNVALLTLRARLELISNGKKPLVFKTQNNWLYQEFGNKKADNDLSSRNYLYFRPFNRVYPFGMLYLSTNYRRQIEGRWFGGAGGTWQMVRTPNSNIKIAGSIVYEQTNFKTDSYNETAYNGSDRINIWRATAWFAGWHKLFDQRLRLYYSAYIQPGLSGIDNYRSQMEAGLDFPVWKGLNFSLMYNYTHEDVVVTGIKQNDGILTFGISYQIKK